MKGTGCEVCPVKKCDAVYRSSRCAANRSKFHLDDPETNFDWLQSMKLEEMANFICSLFTADACYRCPGSDYCQANHEGTIDWLKMQREK